MAWEGSGIQHFLSAPGRVDVNQVGMWIYSGQARMSVGVLRSRLFSFLTLAYWPSTTWVSTNLHISL